MKNETGQLNKRSFFRELLHPDKKIVSRVRGGIDKQFLVLVVLLVCFGSVIGAFIGNVITLVRLFIEDRKYKKRMRELEQNKEIKD